MSDQHAATALTAAAVIAVILIVGAAVLRPDGRGRGARTLHPSRRDVMFHGGAAAPPDGGAPSAVREAEQHVHRCWQRLQAPTDPPE
ncbi:hypothetical protein GCM10010129_00520 [Streptomyces fumigatiscleroticus]|nr:hypothetical protein GCM10010129_00520 [Streptomyces fumigatiscleroticus]